MMLTILKRTSFAIAYLPTFLLFANSAVSAQEAAVETSNVQVGRSREDFIMTPVNQKLTPFGRQVELNGLRPQAIALSPDGRLLVVSGKTSELIVLDPESGDVKQRVRFPVNFQVEFAQDPTSANILKPDGLGQVSFTGLIFSPDGQQIFLSNVNGSIKVFSVNEKGEVLPSRVFP